jgi:hypothetical protein
MKLLRAIIVGVAAGLAVWLIGVILVSLGTDPQAFLQKLGNVLEDISAPVGILAFLYSLATGWPWDGWNRRGVA